MRHFLLALAISVLPLSMRVAAVTAALVANAGRTHRRAARLRCAGGAAVPVAAVAVAAEEEDLPARRPRAGHES
jgi:hypothetical protein